MRYSKLFGKTIKETPKDASIASHKLLYRGGFIRESVAGRYYLLPLGMRVQQKIHDIIKDEMDKAGAQEIITPTLHPKELWKETNRTESVGFELMIIKDRNEMEFVLGGTAEEMIVDLVRKFQVSYKDLPFNIYQFSNKFRDELRAKGGLLRLREFLMKDGYSFHSTQEDFAKEYQNMTDTYVRSFKRMDLVANVVPADNGYIGGDYSHEFIVDSDAGESRYFIDEDGYLGHEDIAKVTIINEKIGEELKPMEEVLGEGIIGVEELAKFLNVPVEQTTKTILFENEKGEVIAAAIRGDLDINEAKLLKVTKDAQLKLASPETVKMVTGAEVGFAGVLNLPAEVRVYFDDSVAGRVNFEMGANKTDYHTININFGRDLPEPKEFYDFKLAKEGLLSPNHKPLVARKGIEVGNIFQLGYHYSSKMKGAEFMDIDGKMKPYYMGCYGIGLPRTLAAIVEVHNDEKGIIWPEEVSPFKVHLIGLDLNDDSIKKSAENTYKLLLAEGIEVLFDDREDTMAGAKFADADLIGIPYRVVISKRTGDKLEVKKRSEKETNFYNLEDLIKVLK
jgi:prolyl-tRNA synthetase